MNKDSIKLHSNFTVNKEIADDDTRFLQVTIDVLHTGQNYNGSVFEKEVVDACSDSIKNTAILGFIEYNKKSQENDFKGHEYVVTKTKNGVEEKYIGHAYGVVPESCNPRWVTKTSSDGVERDYFQVDALLWTKFDDCIDIIERDGSKAQSMELEISSAEGTEDDNGIFHFSKFRFNGCCLLGSQVEPAMIDANITKVQFSVSEFVKQIQNELNNKYTQFTKLECKNKQGGNEPMSKNKTDFQTVLNQFEDISNIVSQYESINNRWGDSVPRYCAVDIQDNEVIVADRKDNHTIYGCSFTVDGDKPVIDFSTATRKKITYVNYENGANTVSEPTQYSIGQYITDIEDKAFSKFEEVNSKVTEVESEKEKLSTDYSAIKAEYDELKPKYDNYVKAEQERIEAEVVATKNEIFSRFESALKDSDEYAELKDQMNEYSADEIETKCAVLFTRQNLKSIKKKDSATVRVHEYDDESNGFVSTVYGDIPVNK